MLFSALVDADYLDTEAHFQGDAAGKHPRAPGVRLDPEAGLDALQRVLAAGLVAIIADDECFYGLVTRFDLINHLRKKFT
jgi:hydrogenase/urease accessory protein HupE